MTGNTAPDESVCRPVNGSQVQSTWKVLQLVTSVGEVSISLLRSVLPMDFSERGQPRRPKVLLMFVVAGIPKVPRMIRSRCVEKPLIAPGSMLLPTATIALPLGHIGAPAPTGHVIGAMPLPGVLKGTDMEDNVTAPPPTGSGVCSRSVGEISLRTLPKSLAATSTHPDCITGLGMRLVLSEMRLRSRIS